MNGTTKQTKYAKNILDGLKAWADETLNAPYPEPGTPEAMRLHTHKAVAEDIAVEIAVIEAVESGDIEKAQELYSEVKNDSRLAACLDGKEIVASKIIDSYKKPYYDLARR